MPIRMNMMTITVISSSRVKAARGETVD